VTIQWLTAVRHGESTANAAFADAERTDAERTGAERTGAASAVVDGPDHAVPLTPLGRGQSAALGRRLAALPPGEIPDLVLCSPYARARETLLALGERFACAAMYDERLRDRDMGVLDLMTAQAVRRRHPEEHARRKRLGELYYRPPGGESLADVALRLRSLLAEPLSGSVLLVVHDAVVQMLRYVLDGELMPDPVANASVTRWRRVEGRLRLMEWNTVLR
jgi:2,3-bisphosphoglycerate-dependent phosphoglycerate mutase